MAQFNGYSIFTIFTGEIYLLQAIYLALENKEFKEKIDGVDMVEHPDLRRLVLILSQKQCVFTNSDSYDMMLENDTQNYVVKTKPS